MKKFFGMSILAGAMIFNTTCANAAVAENATADRETINQIALLQSLTLGHFQGSMTVGEWKKLGDTGIGTFEGLNGEMIVLDGVVYQGDQNCNAKIMSDKVKIPFSNITFFDKDFSVKLNNIANKTALEKTLNKSVSKHGANNFYMVKIPAEYKKILIRSEAGQKKPYPTLVEALKTQKEVTLKNIRGTIVGLYCPAYMSSLNSVGWRFHFISDDKKFAGHVLDMNIKSGDAQFDKTAKFELYLPKDKNFHKLNLGQDLREDIRKAENDTQGE